MAGYGKRKKRKQNRLAMFSITLVVLTFMVVLGYQTLELQKKNDEYNDRLVVVERELEQQTNRREELERQRTYVQTKQYIEEQAKEKLGLVNPNEIILKPKQ